MSWMSKLLETYEACAGNPHLSDRPLPVGYVLQPVQLEITLKLDGGVSARVLENELSIPIPCTESSAARSGKRPLPHPLCDKLQYVAKDFRAYGGKVTTGFASDLEEPFKSYERLLRGWAEYSGHPKLRAILAYVEQGHLMADLVEQKIFPVDNGKIIFPIEKMNRADLLEWKKRYPVYAVQKDPLNCFVCWCVESLEENGPGRVWEDKTLMDSWLDYTCNVSQTKRQMCMIQGREMPVALLHPKKIFLGAANAKLISSNDTAGFTFRGRFTDGDGLQACSLGYETTQKAHSALSWLIRRQGNASGAQVYICWAASGKKSPPILVSTLEMQWPDEDEELPAENFLPADKTTLCPDYSADAGQTFAQRLNKFMNGYRQHLDPTEELMVIGLDSSTDGRMSIIFYRELLNSELLDRLERWHKEFAWHIFGSLPSRHEQRNNSAVWAIYAPSPELIAKTAYGSRVEDSQKKKVRERLAACLVDGAPLPVDIMQSCVRHAIVLASSLSRRGDGEWKQALGVACALYKGYYRRRAGERRFYSMALEENRTGRDYLFGRLLAIAERIETVALDVAGEKRPTTAVRLMQRFAEQPCSTWRTMELSLNPYMQRLKSDRSGFFYKMKRLMNEVMSKFEGDDFTARGGLSGEFLLGYHCQLNAFQNSRNTDSEEDNSHDQSATQD